MAWSYGVILQASGRLRAQKSWRRDAEILRPEYEKSKASHTHERAQRKIPQDIMRLGSKPTWPEGDAQET